MAGTIVRAIAARNTKPRYAVGQYAKPLMWARKWLGDRLFDRIVMHRVNRLR